MPGPTLPLSDVKARLSEWGRRVSEPHERITVTRNGEAQFVLVSIDDLEGLEITLAVLSDEGAKGTRRLIMILACCQECANQRRRHQISLRFDLVCCWGVPDTEITVTERAPPGDPSLLLTFFAGDSFLTLENPHDRARWSGRRPPARMAILPRCRRAPRPRARQRMRRLDHP